MSHYEVEITQSTFLTLYNTAYTVHYICPNFSFAETSYTLSILYEINKQENILFSQTINILILNQIDREGVPGQ